MSFPWPDPPCPIVGVDGAVPMWLSLKAFPGGGRNWYCCLCQQWADTSHLSGRRHQNRLWVLSQRQCSSMLGLQAAAARQLVSPTSDRLAVQSRCCTSADTGGLSMGIVSSSRSCADQHPNMNAFQHCPSAARITSMSQLAPDVLEELAELARSKLGTLSSSSTHVSVTPSASDRELVSDVAPRC